MTLNQVKIYFSYANLEAKIKESFAKGPELKFWHQHFSLRFPVRFVSADNFLNAI